MRGRYTCYCVGDSKFISIIAGSPQVADRRTDESCELIIQGTAGAIGARTIMCWSKTGKPLAAVESILKEGASCTIEIGDSIRIENATYCSKRDISNLCFLIFKKNDIFFWVCSEIGRVQFISINGKNL